MISRREKGKADRKARILNAARDMIQESGDVGLSMRALADRADVSLMTLYNLLGSRQAVLLEVLIEDINSAGETFKNGNFRDPLDALFGLIPFIRQQFEDSGYYWNVVVLSLFQKGAEHIRREVRDRTQATWGRVLNKARTQGFLRPSIDLDNLTIALDNVFYANSFSLACGDIDGDLFVARAQYSYALILAGAVSRPHALRVRAFLNDCQLRCNALEQDAPATVEKKAG